MTPVKNATSLPSGFEALEPFVSQWAVRGSQTRKTQRVTSTPQQRAEFYEVAKALLPDALSHLDSQRIDALSERDQRLLDLMLSLAHVALAVEVQGDQEPQHAVSAGRFTIYRSSEDIVTRPGRIG